MKKKIEISPLILFGIILIVIGFTLGFIYYYVQQNSECIRNPVDYANNHSNNYGWDEVTVIDYEFFD